MAAAEGGSHRGGAGAEEGQVADMAAGAVSGVVEGVEEVAVGSGVGQMDTITRIGNTDCHKY